jgi:hypothetical protein
MTEELKNKSDSEQVLEKKEFRKKLNSYKKSLKHTLATTRFNNYTWEENCNMRQKNPSVKCIYATPIQVSSRVILDTNVFIMEMNNDRNEIMGIGLVKNHPIAGKYAVHSNQNYNRFAYIGKWRIDRDDMSEEERCVLKLIEAMCFRGINHSKRGQGITAFPIKLQYNASLLGVNLLDCICNMFKIRMNG